MRSTSVVRLAVVVVTLLVSACGDQSADEGSASIASPAVTDDCSLICGALLAGECISGQSSCVDSCMKSWRACAGWQETVDCFTKEPVYSCGDPTPPACREKLTVVLSCGEGLAGPAY